MLRPAVLGLLVLAAGCVAGETPAPRPALPTQTVAGREVVRIPAGEFLLEGRQVYLPEFWVAAQSGAPSGELAAATDAEVVKARDPRYGQAAGDGPWAVWRPPVPDRPQVRWRPDFWAAVDEARRRNCLVFVTCHWDGCGNCDRYRQKNLHDPAFVAFVNANVVMVLGIHNHDSMAAHAPLPDGRCWIVPGLTCAQHRACFDDGESAMGWFPMSPGHAILWPHAGASADFDEWRLVGDEQLPDEGTPQWWIERFRAEQEQLGELMPAGVYERQRAEFEAAGPEEWQRIAAAAGHAFSDDARLALEGDPDAARVDAAVAALAAGRTADAVPLLDGARGLRAHRLRLQLERRAWRLLSQARRTDDDRRRRAVYQRVIDEYPGMEAAGAALEEIE